MPGPTRTPGSNGYDWCLLMSVGQSSSYAPRYKGSHIDLDMAATREWAKIPFNATLLMAKDESNNIHTNHEVSARSVGAFISRWCQGDVRSQEARVPVVERFDPSNATRRRRLHLSGSEPTQLYRSQTCSRLSTASRDVAKDEQLGNSCRENCCAT